MRGIRRHEILVWFAIPVALAAILGVAVRVLAPGSGTVLSGALAEAPAATRPTEAPSDTKDAPAPPAPASQGVVVARVNGRPIYESDIAAVPAKAFGVDVARVRDMKLQRRIQSLSLSQFLDAHHVFVGADIVERTVADLRKTPPSAGCPCCRYASLEQFMEDNFFTLDELRTEIRNKEGLKRYVQSQWDREYPKGPKQTAYLQKERPALEGYYVKASQIFFNTFQKPDYAAPDRVRAEARKKAEAAYARLRKGESFPSVARDVSEDLVSRPEGGELGCIPKDFFGREFAAAVTALKPGQCSAPFESPWGYHIVLRQNLTDDDLLDMVKSRYLAQATSDALKAAEDDAKVELIEKGEGGESRMPR